MTWILILLLIIIHTVDMVLTRYYIGDNYKEESFFPMSSCINAIGIYNSIWLSRIIMYSYFFFALINQENKKWFYFLILVTILYYTSMIEWTFQLGIIKFPFPFRLLNY